MTYTNKQITDSGTEWVLAVQYGSQTLMEQFYLENKEEFLGWGQSNFKLSREDLLEIYQESSLILYENIMDGKLMQLKSSVKTYLYGIGKNLLYKKFRLEKRDSKMKMNLDPGLQIEEDPELYERGRLAMKMLEGMNEPCKTILSYYYREMMKLEQIADLLKYKSKDVVKTQKSRCLKTLKERLQEAIG